MPARFTSSDPVAVSKLRAETLRVLVDQYPGRTLNQLALLWKCPTEIMDRALNRLIKRGLIYRDRNVYRTVAKKAWEE